jgi:hypothetical protein
MFVTFIDQMFCDIVQHLVAGSSKYVCNIYWSYYSLLQDAVLCHRTSDQLMLQTYLIIPATRCCTMSQNICNWSDVL